jgi:UDP-glucose:(heptosyl)LPS alpha-1,3-glucosyltransferase
VDRERFAPAPEARARLRAELGLGDDQPVAVFVGGDWERKGLRYALEALPLADGWHLLVVGAGDEPHYRRLAGELGVESRVRFAGATAQPAPYYSCADGFLLPTAYEAAPLVVLEAAAAGLPLLVSRVNGVEEILVEGRNGWFVDRDAKVIADRLNELGRDPARRREMGEAARADTARFGWAGVVDEYDRLYRELAEAAA